MRTAFAIQLAGALAVMASIAAAADVAAQRQMNVRQGPETVFDVPVAEVLPVLAAAQPTDVNGRVGNEFVFWGYRLDDGREAWLYACLLSSEVDCPRRREQVCDATTTVLAEQTWSGTTVERRCNGVAVVAVGDAKPGCVDFAQTAPLSIGVVSCSAGR